MSDSVRNLSLRHQPPRERQSRARQDSKPAADDPGEEDREQGPSRYHQDAKFFDAMTEALRQGKERLPPEAKPSPVTVPRRLFVPGRVFSASNLEN